MRRIWLLLPILVVPFAFWLIGRDALYFLSWWLAITLIGLVWWPVASRLLPAADNGWILAKGMGLALSAGTAFVLHHITPFPFQRIWLIFLLALTAAIIWTYDIWSEKLKNLLPGFFAVQTKTSETFGIPSYKNGLKPDRTTIISAKEDRCFYIGAAETVFGAALLFWLFTRGLKPELDTLEKFMNIGFMNSIWRSGQLPAVDMWFSGESINYYYFGHYASTWLARITNIRPVEAYHLAMASLAALSLVLASAFGIHIIQTLHHNTNTKTGPAAEASRIKKKLITICAAVTSGFLVVFGGNQHAFLFTENSPVQGLMSYLIDKSILPGSNEASFWFANSTRYIGYNPETTDKTIHEFPFYSYLVADLHAHVINLVFVLTFLLLAIAFFRKYNGQRSKRVDYENGFRSFISEPLYYLISAFLAIFMMANYWDFIIYFALFCLILWITFSRSSGTAFTLRGIPVFMLQSSLIIFVFLKIRQPLLALLMYMTAALINLFIGTRSKDGLTGAGSRMGWIFFLAHLFALPFNYDFDPIAKEIALTTSKTPLSQLWVLWGAHIFAALLFVVWLIFNKRRLGLRKTFPPLKEQQHLALEQTANPFRRFTSFITRLMADPANKMVSAIISMGVLLIILPELVYVVDIYSGDFKRANTMFKFTYQAYVLLSLAWGSAAALMLSSAYPDHGSSAMIGHRNRAVVGKSNRKQAASIAAAVILLIMLIIPAWYPLNATIQWLGPIDRNRYQGLDSLSAFALKDSASINGDNPGELSADVAAIKWLNENIEGQPVVLEAFGDSYTDYNRVSAFTGLPTIIGWQTHEWLWRTSAENPDAYSTVVIPRQQAVRDIYTTEDQQLRIELINEYQVEYIVIGQLEREKFSTVSEDDRVISLVREDLISKLGHKVFSKGRLTIYKLD